MAIAGKKALVKVSTVAGGAGAYNTVDEIGEVSMSHSGGTLDTTKFNNDYMARIYGLKDVSFSISGTWDSADTNGQVAIRNAWLNETELWFQYLPDGSAGFKAQVVVSSCEIKSSVGGRCEFSATLDLAGGVAPAAV